MTTTDDRQDGAAVITTGGFVRRYGVPRRRVQREADKLFGAGLAIVSRFRLLTPEQAEALRRHLEGTGLLPAKTG